jgi:DNA polymerase-3 subunit epsilon
MWLLFDTETTGLTLPSVAPIEKQPHIIELAYALVQPGGSIFQRASMLFDPGVQLSEEITKITGLTNADLVGKPKFADMLDALKEAWHAADAVVAHNAPFDVMMMNVELQRAGCDDFPWPLEVVCTVQEFKHELGHRQTLGAFYELKLGKKMEKAHRAMDDVMALYEVLNHIGFFA